MSATLSKGYLIALGTLNYLHRDHLLMAGLIVDFGITNPVLHRSDMIAPSRSATPVFSAAAEGPAAIEGADTVATIPMAADVDSLNVAAAAAVACYALRR